MTALISSTLWVLVMTVEPQGLLSLSVDSATGPLIVTPVDSPSERFAISAPQVIGTRESVQVTPEDAKGTWAGPDPDGAYRLSIDQPLLRYDARVIPFADHVDVWETVRNSGSLPLEQVFTFTCFSAQGAAGFADPTWQRTLLPIGGKPVAITQLERPRPTTKFAFFRTADAAALPRFASRYQATAQGDLSASFGMIIARDRTRAFLVGTQASTFLYADPEHSCLHATPRFGNVRPGDSASALTRMYVLSGSEPTAACRYDHDFRGAAITPSMRAAPATAAMPTLHGLDVFPAREDAGHSTLRLPESLGNREVSYFLDEQKTTTLSAWQVDASTGAFASRTTLSPGLVIETSASPQSLGVALKLVVTNAHDRAMGTTSVQVCLRLDAASTLCEPSLRRTFFHTSGSWLALANATYPDIFSQRAPWLIVLRHASPRQRVTTLDFARTEELADLPVLAATSANRRQLVAIAWTGATRLMSNGAIPCLHSDPVLPECAPGRSVRSTGFLYLLEGSLEDLARRVKVDFADEH